MELIIICGICILIGLVISIRNIYYQVKYPVVEGTIVDIGTSRQIYYGIALYTVGGVEYTARTTISKPKIQGSGGLIGRKVLLHYNPNNPSSAVCDNAKALLGFIFFLALSIGFIYVFMNL